MKKLSHSENSRAFIIAVTFVFLWLLPEVQAVIPAPDGGYPGLNTAEGQSALLSLSTGTANTAVGWFSLQSNTDGTFNTGVGAATLLSNAGNQSTGEGVNNTAIGTASLLFNTTGSENTAVGAAALLNNVDGSDNNAVGVDALFSNISGHDNTATGDFALFSNTTGSNNTASGRLALQNSNGDNNTAIGAFALQNSTTGSNNTALGYQAGSSLDTGDNNIDIGSDVVGVAGESNTIRIGSQGVQTRTFIAGIWDHLPNIGSVAVQVDSNGQLTPVSSSRRFKHDIEPMRERSAAVLALKPVAFRYKGDAKNTPCFGLIAEDVEKVNPDLVVRDKEGKPYSVRYDQVNAMLLNEFLKEHDRVKELECTVQEQQAVITRQQESFESRLAEQDKQIERLTSGLQKVSAALETRRPAPQVVRN